MKRERNPIQHSFKILDVLSKAQTPMSLTEISDLMDVHKSTVLRLLAVLTENGYVERDAMTSRYRLGPELIALAGAALKRNPMVEVAQPILDQVARDTRETVTLSVWNGKDAIDVAMSAGLEQITYAPTLGMKNPSHCTATGKIFLAALPEKECNKLLSGELKQYTSRTIVSKRKLLEELVKVRQSGVARNIEEFTYNLCAIGVPVGEAITFPIGALVVSVPKFRFDAEFQAKVTDILKRGALAISARMAAHPRDQ